MQELTFEKINQAKDIDLVEYPVKEWDGILFLKPMNVKERFEFQERHWGKPAEQEGSVDQSATHKAIVFDMLTVCVTNSRGMPLFDSENINLLETKNWDVVTRLFNKCSAINLIDTKAEDEAKKKSEMIL